MYIRRLLVLYSLCMEIDRYKRHTEMLIGSKHIPFSAVDVKWLGVHYYDIFDSTNDSCKVTEDVLQPWSPSDEKTYSGLCTALKEYVCTHRVTIIELTAHWYISKHSVCC